MKKTFPVNINGTVFYIDEDAYALLNKYLDQLRAAFPGEEGREVVNDIEARIAELFGEMISGGACVITIADVNHVIDQMGRPSDLSDSENAEEAAPTGATPPPFTGVTKKLYRNMQNKVFGGVLSGVACYFGWNTNILRLLIAVLALFTYLWPLVVIYLVAWMVIPAATTPRQILEMKGAPVTVGNVGQTIIGSSDPDASDQSAGIWGALGKAVLIFFGIVAGLVALGLFALFIKLVCGLILWGGWDNYSLLEDFDIIHTNFTLGAIGSICLLLCIALPCIALVWATCSVVFKVKGISKPVLIGAGIIEVLLIIAATVLLSLAAAPALAQVVTVAAATNSF